MKIYSYNDLAAAYVRGEAHKKDIGLPEELTAVPLEELSEDQKDRLFTRPSESGTSADELQSLTRVLG